MKKKIAVIITAFSLMLAVCVCVPAAALASDTVSESEVLLIAPAPDSEPEDIIDDELLEELLSDADGAVDTTLNAGSLDDGTKADIKEMREQNIKDSLKIMGQGMLGIFVVMLLIYLVVVILNAVTHDSSADEEDSE